MESVHLREIAYHYRNERSRIIFEPGINNLRERTQVKNFIVDFIPDFQFY